MPFLKRTSVSEISGSDLAGLVSDFIEVTPSDVTTLDYILSQTSAKNVAGLLHDSEMIKFVIKKVAKAKLQPQPADETAVPPAFLTVCRHCGKINEYSVGDQLTS